jgi:hypothetical protein
MNNRYRTWSPAGGHGGVPSPDDPSRKGGEAPSFVRPVRWPLAIAVALLALGGFSAIVLVSARPTSLAGVSATVADMEQRDLKAGGVEGAAPSSELSLEDHRAVIATLRPALLLASRACNTIAPGWPMDVRVTMSAAGAVLGASIVSGPLEGTSAAQCVGSRLVGLKVADYQAGAATVVEAIPAP